MKAARLPSLFLAATFAVLLFTTGVPALVAQQSLLLSVNVSNPVAVTFTTTGGPALNSDASRNFGTGFDLLNFFRGPASSYTAMATNTTLSTFQNGFPNYDNAVTDVLSGTPVDLNIYSGFLGYLFTQTFAADTQAFVGSATFDLSSINPALLPAIGYVGDIYSGNNTSGTAVVAPDPNLIVTQVLIGQYIVVPEANSGVLLLVGGALLIVGDWCRRRFAA